VRPVRYLAIADDLRDRVAGGEFAAGRLLPSESELSGAYDASRVTVRKALEALREEGLVDARQGFGWFVAADPLRQSLGRLGTIEGQLASSGLTPERRVLDFEFVTAPAWVAAELGKGTVLRVRRLNLADGEPFARVTVWCPERLGSALSRDEVERSPFYELLPIELGGATQTIGAAAASAEDATVLAIPVGSPVLVCRRITTSVEGDPVLISEHVFPAHRTEFVVDLPRSEPSIAPTGMRLVE
jgi:GntR family transcriptional regulator